MLEPLLERLKEPENLRKFLAETDLHTLPLDQLSAEQVILLAKFLIADNQLENFRLLVQKKNKIHHDVLFFAIEQKKPEFVACLLQNGMKPNHQKQMDESHYESALSLAVKKQDEQTVFLLYQAGARLEYSYLVLPSRFCVSIKVLGVAMQCGGIQVIDILTASEKNLFKTLCIAIEFTDSFDLCAENFKHLLEKGLILQNPLQRINLLKRAIAAGNLTVIDILLKDEPDLSAYDKHKPLVEISLLKSVLVSRYLEDHEKFAIAERLILLGADVNANDSYEEAKNCVPVVHSYARYGNDKLLKLLAIHQAKFDVVDSFQQTALHHAAIGRNLSTFTFLLERNGVPTISPVCGTVLTALVSKDARSSSTKKINQLISLVLSLPVDVNFLIDFSGDKKSKPLHSALLLVIKQFPVNFFLVRSLLEAGADPNIGIQALPVLLAPECGTGEHFIATRKDRLQQYNIQRLYVAGLLIDYEAIISETCFDRYEITNDRKPYGLKAGTYWPYATEYFKALKFEKAKDYVSALEILKACPHADHICWRQGIIYQKLGKYDEAYTCFKKVIDKEDYVNGISVTNELVDLFFTWNKAIDQGGQRGKYFEELFECIQHLPHDELTASAHGKLVEIYLQSEGLTFSERRDLLMPHLTQATQGQFKDFAKSCLASYLTPENQFKYELDKVITKTDITPVLKKQILKNMLAQADSDALKNTAVEFIITHETAQREGLTDAIKDLRHASVNHLMASVNSLLLLGRHAVAIQKLDSAKTKPLYNMLKTSSFLSFKNKTNAIDKIENKLKEIKRLSIK